MKAKQIDGKVGAVSINFETKEVTWFGMDGCGDTPPEDVLAFCKEAESQGCYTGYLIFWTDVNQLSVYDESGFLEECFTYEDEED